MRAVIDGAVEIGREGREGKSAGTPIVVGDVRDVLARARTLGLDPFKGSRRKVRKLRDLRVREAIEEIAQSDGAFVVARAMKWHDAETEPTPVRPEKGT